LPIDPEIAKLCDVGRVEDYPAETFVSIAKDLTGRTPEAQHHLFLKV